MADKDSEPCDSSEQVLEDTDEKMADEGEEPCDSSEHMTEDGDEKEVEEDGEPCDSSEPVAVESDEKDVTSASTENDSAKVPEESSANDTDKKEEMEVAGGEQPQKKAKKKKRSAVPLADSAFNHKLLNLINAAAGRREVLTSVKRVIRALNQGNAELVIMSANGPYYEPVEEMPELCKEKNVPYIYVKSMALLGAACNVVSDTGTRVCVLISKDGSKLKHQIKTFRKKCERLLEQSANV
ncbi:H/ACA ribonucleoprotein complex subunit 2-like [Procambarus clarkii]|uniref:H/ACA ribonucleoprotein complex subunit 2 n=1 Tax=Procambarus clarkii TaxID=6728 RepID=UPI001E6744BB|nr:H/ACA ribonucleoprotein complex subunit 2-like [Procambarus clarkii]